MAGQKQFDNTPPNNTHLDARGIWNDNAVDAETRLAANESAITTLQNEKIDLDGGNTPMSGVLKHGSHVPTCVTDPSTDDELVRKGHLDTKKIESFTTDETNAGQVLRPDGAGGVEFVSTSNQIGSRGLHARAYNVIDTAPHDVETAVIPAEFLESPATSIIQPLGYEAFIFQDDVPVGDFTSFASLCMMADDTGGSLDFYWEAALYRIEDIGEQYRLHFYTHYLFRDGGVAPPSTFVVAKNSGAWVQVYAFTDAGATCTLWVRTDNGDMKFRVYSDTDNLADVAGCQISFSVAALG